MSGVNKVILVGHLGKDPEFRIIENDVAVVSFPLVTSEGFTKNGTKTEQTEWHNIVMWRATAENAAKMLQKGKLVYLEGKIHTRCYEDKLGFKRYTTEIIAETFRILGRNSDLRDEALKTDTDENNASKKRSSVI